MYCIQTKDLRYGLHLGKSVHQTEANKFKLNSAHYW